MNRALPGWAVDLVRVGVRGPALDAGGDRAVWNALFKTAASACQRGWDRWEWEEFVLRTGQRLGQQARLKKGGRKERTPVDVAALFDDCWDKATAWASEQPPAADWHEEINAAQKLRDRIADPATPLNATDRAVLLDAIDQAVERQSVSPALPRHMIVKRTGLGDRTVRNALDRLTPAGLLPVVHAGRKGTLSVGGKPGTARATHYGLPTEAALDRYLYRETRSLGPPALVSRTPASDTTGTPREVSRTPLDCEALAATLRAADPAVLAAALALLDAPSAGDRVVIDRSRLKPPMEVSR